MLSNLVPVAICVPVRDEEPLLPSLLAALAAQDRTGADLTACFLLDSCTDRSEATIRAAAAAFPFPLLIATGSYRAEPNAGRARAAAMAIGLDHIGAAPGGLLLSTDADSQPRPDWTLAARRALAVADIAAGQLVRSGADCPVQARIEAYYDRLHAYRRTVDPVPWDTAAGTHFTGGANLAFRAYVYAALGGFGPMPSGEDAALVDDAMRAGFRVRRDPEMIVETSARRHGRAPGGLAATLRTLDRSGPPVMAHPAAAAWQYRAQAEARAAFAMLAHDGVRHRLACSLDLSGDHVLGVARDCPNAEAFAMRIVPSAPGSAPLLALAEAEEALAHLERMACEKAA